MSFGFHKHPAFKLLAAADAQIAKPSMKRGALECNHTYELNMGFSPVSVDLGMVEPDELRDILDLGDQHVHVLSACAPCTGFSRANPNNHLRNDTRNNLVEKSAQFATALDVDILLMENAREVLTGNFSEHYLSLKRHLESSGYHVHASTHMLNKYGLPQVRERALIIAHKVDFDFFGLEDLWEGLKIAEESTHVRHAFRSIRKNATCQDRYPHFSNQTVSDRLAAIPSNGGSWADLLFHENKDVLLTDAMKERARKNKLGSHPDVYGRMWWGRPSPTIKRECAHIGNGRYAHPEENRLCSLREMATLQGFPNEFEFNGSSLSNNYRQIGDAVPPLISYQLAWICHWMFTKHKPTPEQWILADTHLSISDLLEADQPALRYG